MKRVYAIENLGCANCAAKIESSVARLADVKSVNVNFMTQRRTIKAEESGFNGIMTRVAEICRSIEPYCALKAKK